MRGCLGGHDVAVCEGIVLQSICYINDRCICLAALGFGCVVGGGEGVKLENVLELQWNYAQLREHD